MWQLQAAILLGLWFLLLGSGRIDNLPNAEEASVVHSSRSVIQTTVADTVFMEINAGEALIFSLPESLSMEIVDTWRLMKAPAYSQLASRSFLWQTRKTDRGLHTLHFEGTSAIEVDEFTVERIETWTANIRVL